MNDISPIHNALISVSDKSGILEFAQFLADHNIQIFSTGGTADLLRQHDIPVTDVAEYTGYPEMMDGRIKTLHPKIHGGLLGRQPQDSAVMSSHGIEPFDLAVINLYPFEAVSSQDQVTYAEVIENIDVGGPTMIRAAAKNHSRVTVVVSPQDYQEVQQAISAYQGVPQPLRTKLAVKAFARTAAYDAAITEWFMRADKEMPDFVTTVLAKSLSLRYGENPHQKGAFYQDIAASKLHDCQLQGKELSFNNLLDADAAIACVHEFSEPACAIVKHANPCGVACAENITAAYQRAFAADSMSAFGGIIALNQVLEPELTEIIIGQQFVEVIIAPEVDERSLTILRNKPAVRVLAGDFSLGSREIRSVMGGVLVQQKDVAQVTADDLIVKTKRKPNDNEIQDLLFARQVVKHVKSNAIVLAHQKATVGIGAGQSSRIASLRIAAAKAREQKNNHSVMASDAFFPFKDSIEEAYQSGVRAIIQPGGSIHDDEIIACADEYGIAMVFTGIRHFRH